MVHREQQELKVLQVFKELMEHKVLRVFKVKQVLK